MQSKCHGFMCTLNDEENGRSLSEQSKCQGFVCSLNDEEKLCRVTVNCLCCSCVYMLVVFLEIQLYKQSL